MTDSSVPPRVVVLIPALDEEESLPGVLGAIPSYVDRVVVVDNGSTDRTPEVARSLGADVVHEPERGYGAACLAGLRHIASLRPAPTVVVFLDADGSDDPTEIGLLTEPVVSGRADLVLGVRRGEGGDVGTILPHARLGNRIVLGATGLLFDHPFRDLPPFRAIAYEKLVALEMDDRNWGWTLQMQIRAVVRGLRMLEVDVTHRRRAVGHSKISGSLSMSLRVGAKMFYTIARERISAG